MWWFYLWGTLSGVATVLVLVMLERSFRKPTTSPYHATLEAAPGKSTLDITHLGVTHARLVLVRLTISSRAEDTSAEFVDHSNYVADRRIR